MAAIQSFLFRGFTLCCFWLYTSWQTQFHFFGCISTTCSIHLVLLNMCTRLHASNVQLTPDQLYIHKTYNLKWNHGGPWDYIGLAWTDDCSGLELMSHLRPTKSVNDLSLCSTVLESWICWLCHYVGLSWKWVRLVTTFCWLFNTRNHMGYPLGRLSFKEKFNCHFYFWVCYLHFIYTLMHSEWLSDFSYWCRNRGAVE